MKITCEKCNAVYNFDDSKIPSSGIKGRCKKCGFRILIKVENKGDNGVHHKTKTKPLKSSPNNSYSRSLSERLFSVLDVSNFNNRTLIICAAIFVIILSIQINPIRNFLFENHIFNMIDSSAEQVIDDNMKRATAAFAIARGINGIISIIQESQLHIEPGGLGISVAAGEILDPVNDLIERFSWIMLLSLISLGIMKTLIQISSWLSVDIFLSFGLFFILLGMFLKRNKREILFSISKKALLGAIIIRFAVPVVAHLNQKVYYSVLEREYNVTATELEHSNKKLKKLNENMEETSNAKQNTGWMGKLKDATENIEKIVNLETKISSIKKMAGNIADTLVRLSVVFLLNTVLLPIGFLWLFMKVARMLFGSQFALRLEQNLRSKIFQSRKAESTAAFPA